MMKAFVMFKWELKKAFLNPLYVMIFLIVPLLLLLLSNGNKDTEQRTQFPIVAGISAPANIPIATMQSDTLILIKSVPDTMSLQNKQNFFFNLIGRGLLTGAVIITADNEQWVIAGNDAEADIIKKWVSKIIRLSIADSAGLSDSERLLLSEGVDLASTTTLFQQDGMAALWLTAVFVFGVALTGSVFAKSMYEERKGKLLEVFLTTCTPGAIVLGKFSALFVFSILQFGLLYAGVFLLTDSGSSVDTMALMLGGLLGISSLFFITTWFFFTGVSVYSEIGFVGISFFTLAVLSMPVWLTSGSGMVVTEFFRWIPFTMLQSSLPEILLSKRLLVTALQIAIQIAGGFFLLGQSARLLRHRIDR